MAKITFSEITTGFLAKEAMNDNFNEIETEFQSRVLYRDNPTGEPNEMNHDLDMNGYDLLNVGNLSALVTITGVASITWGVQRDGTGTHTISAGDVFKVTEVSSSSSVTACLCLSPESTSGLSSGDWAEYLQKGSGPIKMIAGAGVTIRAKGTVRTNIQYGKVRAHYRGSDIWYLSGDLSAS